MPEDYRPLTVQTCVNTNINTPLNAHFGVVYQLRSLKGLLSNVKTWNESHKGNTVAVCETTVFMHYIENIIIKYFSQTTTDTAVAFFNILFSQVWWYYHNIGKNL